MDEELVDIVDEDGGVIGKSTRSDVCRKGLIHPAVNILVINKKGQIFLQRRSQKKSAFPLFWDISASEHVKSGESFKEAARRGLDEELSVRSKLKLIRPRHIQKSEYKKKGNLIKEYELVELYSTYFDGEIEVDLEEVAEGKFVDIDQLKGFNESNFTPWGLDEVRYILKNLNLISYKVH